MIGADVKQCLALEIGIAYEVDGWHFGFKSVSPAAMRHMEFFECVQHLVVEQTVKIRKSFASMR
jgi:hypothetical protein